MLSLLSTRLAVAGYPGAPTVNINSGNPRYPFPQFLSYGPGRDNLAQVNPVGVPHAEMEQWIRDAWQIFANEFQFTGQTVGGVPYIRANIGCPYDCTEGDGYALIAAAYMGDKQTFDGIWMRFHDTRLRKRPRYSDCVVVQPGYLYGNTPMDNADSAADGDFDAALGILMAWYQWGDDSGVPVCGGVNMSYRAEAEYALRAIVEKARHFPPADCRVTTGHVGFDGYVKAGNTWGERTNWANGCPNPQFNGPDGPEFGGPSLAHIDYIAPSYFRAFGDFLQNRVGLPAAGWEVTQYRRAEASSDWLMGQLIAQGATAIPVAGGLATLTATNATFLNENAAEDARMPWRTILNYVWNGNPTTSWNPTTKQVVAGGNTHELQAGQRFAQFLNNPQGAPWNNACVVYGGVGAQGITFRGAPTVNWTVNMNGGGGTGTFNLNWLMGAGSPAAIAAQNYPLMAELFRQNTIEWDVTHEGDGYLTSRPFYFHGFFRWLGMHILTGNHLNPAALVMPGASPPSNMKIYKSVDRTYAFQGDTITYWLNYRNYASVAANNVVVVDTLPAELGYISAVPAPTSAPAVGSTGVVRWNLPSAVPGLQNQNYAATRGGITLVARVLAPSGRFCNVASVSTSNGTGWTSNQYPNEVSTVMKRNCVDIVPAVMSLTKTAAPAVACSGDRITFSLAYRNNPGAWLNGGRPDVVVSFANAEGGASNNQLLAKFRIMHAADEPYIDYGNYRISYFINDPANPPGSWGLNSFIGGEGGAGAIVTQEALPPGPTWNQRLIIRFASALAAPAIHLYNYTGLVPRRIHRGVGYVFRAIWQMHHSAWMNVNWTDDWSWNPGAFQANDGGVYFPITADWTAGDGTSIPVTRVHPDACQTATHTVNNILVEEWDGYTWRRAFGNGPVAGRQLSNVVISDVLDPCLSFGGFVGAAGTYNAGTRTVSWTLPNVNINETGTLQFWVTAGACGGPVNNTATMAATNENPIQSTVVVNPGAACGGTPTRTGTPSPSPTRTPTPSATRTPSPSATRTATPTATLTATSAQTATSTRTPTPSATRTATPTPSPSASATASATPTRSATPSPSPSRTPTPTPSQTLSASATPSRTASPSASATPSGTPSASATRTASPSPSATSTLTVTPTASPSATPPPPDSTATATPTPSPSFSATRTASPSPSATPTLTATPTGTPSRTASPSATVTPSASPSPTGTATPTASPAATWTPTATLSFTPVPPDSTATATPTASPSFSATPTASPSATVTSSRTSSVTASSTATAADTFTATPSATPPPPGSTATFTFTVTPTPSVTPTFTSTASPSATPSATQAPSSPLIAGLGPDQGPAAGGNTVTVVGGGFLPGAVVLVDGAPVAAVFVDSGTLVVVMPPHTPGSAAVVVRNPDNALSNPADYLYLPGTSPTATPTVSPTPATVPTATPSPAIRFYQQPSLIQERGIYPNPFSDRVRIYFSLRVDAGVRLTVYNVAGEVIATQEQGFRAGKREIVWDGRNSAGARCASGVYILKVEAEGLDRSRDAYWASAVIKR